MALTKHILIDEEVNKILDKMKIHPRETYNDILRRLLKLKILKGGLKK